MCIMIRKVFICNLVSKFICTLDIEIFQNGRNVLSRNFFEAYSFNTTHGIQIMAEDLKTYESYMFFIIK